MTARERQSNIFPATSAQTGMSAVSAFSNNVAGFGAMITLLDGRVINSDDVIFDPNTYHETYTGTGEDITNLMKQADKVATFAGFDKGIDDDRVYRETTVARGYKDPGPPSTDTGFGFILGQTAKGSLSQLGQVVSPGALKSDLKDLIFFAVIGLAIFYGIGFRE